MSRILLVLTALCPLLSALAAPADYFGIEVVDEETGRGVPMVELKTTSSATYYTDSSGFVAFYEPGLMNQKVWFSVAAHGYESAPDGFGMRGVSLDTKPEAVSQIKIKRLNIAQRLYRITGQGIYRDTIMLGRKTPIKQPLFNAQVTGQDSILNTIYKGKLYWLPTLPLTGGATPRRLQFFASRADSISARNYRVAASRVTSCRFGFQSCPAAPSSLFARDRNTKKRHASVESIQFVFHPASARFS